MPVRIDFYKDSGHRIKRVQKANRYRRQRYECELCGAHSTHPLKEIKARMYRAAPCYHGQAMLFDGNFTSAPDWRLE